RSHFPIFFEDVKTKRLSLLSVGSHYSYDQHRVYRFDYSLRAARRLPSLPTR
ncbi:hypothetical protein F442_22378, partial [Phytophthora nicotianae P10297]